MKKNKMGMSIILISVLFVLCIVSFTNKQIYSFLGIENLKNDISSLTSDNTTDNKSNTDSTSAEVKKVFPNVFETNIPSYKLKSMNESVQVKLTFHGDETSNCTFLIKSAKATKVCPGYTFSNDAMKYLKNGTIDENGTLLKDFYYVDVAIAVTNTSGRVDSYSVNNTKIVQIEGELNKATFYSGSGLDYNGAKVDQTPYYWEETDGKSLIPIMEFIQYFQPEEKCEYRACYIIPQEYVNSDNIYIYDSMDSTSHEGITCEGQRFIKLNISKEE